MKYFDQIDALYGDLANIETLDDIIRLSIAFDKPVKIQAEKLSELYSESLEPYSDSTGLYSEEKEKTFVVNNNVIAYFFDGVHYEIHYTEQVEQVLLKNGFKCVPEDSFFVGCGTIFGHHHQKPINEIGQTIVFAGEAVEVRPIDFLDFWNKQEFEADCINRNSRKRKRKESIQEIVVQSGCTPIEESLLTSRCFRIPTSGLEVKVQGSVEAGTRYVPEIDNYFGAYAPAHEERVIEERIVKRTILPSKEKMIGKIDKIIYSQEPGKSVWIFVYLDGCTYMTSSEEVIEELKKHGFTGTYERVLCLDEHVYTLESILEIYDPFYAKQYSEVMISDTEYKVRQDETEASKSDGDQLIDSIARSYIRYCQEAEERKEDIISVREFVINKLGLLLPNQIINKIEIAIKK